MATSRPTLDSHETSDVARHGRRHLRRGSGIPAADRRPREWRNTPKDHGQSPAEVIFGRSIRSTLPSLRQLIHSPDTPEKAEREEKKAILQEKVRERFNARSKPLDKLPIGANVWIQDPNSKKWTQSGKVIAIGERRSYDVRLGDGRIWTRNRKFLRPKLSDSKTNSVTKVHRGRSANVMDSMTRSRQHRQLDEVKGLSESRIGSSRERTNSTPSPLGGKGGCPVPARWRQHTLGVEAAILTTSQSTLDPQGRRSTT